MCACENHNSGSKSLKRTHFQFPPTTDNLFFAGILNGVCVCVFWCCFLVFLETVIGIFFEEVLGEYSQILQRGERYFFFNLSCFLSFFLLNDLSQLLIRNIVLVLQQFKVRLPQLRCLLEENFMNVVDVTQKRG